MNRVVSDSSHVQRVRRLYKLILRLHRGLPTEMRSLGDDYARAEFKRHKDAEQQFIPVFMNEWTNYAITLAEQLGKHTTSKALGLKLDTAQLNSLRDDQIGQLFELFQEIQNPSDSTQTNCSVTDSVNGSGGTNTSQS